MRPLDPAITALVPIIGTMDMVPNPRSASYGAGVTGWREAAEGTER